MSNQIILEDISHIELGQSKPYREDKELIRFQKDLLNQYNLPFNEKALLKGLQNDFIDISSKLLDRFTLEELHRFDLILIAYDTPNIDPSYSLIGYLTEKYKLEGLCFAMSDYGLDIGFGALKVAAKMMENADFTKALLIVLEQNTLPYHESGDTHYSDGGMAITLSKNEAEKNSHIIEKNLSFQLSENFSVEDIEKALGAFKDTAVISNQELRGEVRCRLAVNGFRTSNALYEYSRLYSSDRDILQKNIWLIHYDPQLNKASAINLMAGNEKRYIYDHRNQ
ncbi:hypothetical protein [Rossellomorea aquimaris]|uniref:3-oxoacyl-ACP synthase n=1 Tax=Rossellomorea aquimaris TaxID=189382 RepID=A0A1J6VWY6_9BACI|nr:hypothetical protein [Rossellomorea aquimaris]OIU69826.1 hypothetical protein BHE18_02645 [Rossellomorea aquimaris]